ncbi:unnamed protein product [Ranitomeya imitator]|uniref:CHY-type domain-containing protein n=1 Tax=Ranitomeya imitator TaxID=111125 RepID=A0ABN9LGG8_9NEOB|nr:unnamed protein product [Ranitomeya imitator]
MAEGSGDMEVAAGCEHYTRGCELRAPCCGKFYTCRLCHDNKETHKMDRFKVTQVQCLKCKCIQKRIICMRKLMPKRIQMHAYAAFFLSASVYS